MNKNELINTYRNHVINAIADHNLKTVYVSYSGGEDSAVAVELMRNTIVTGVNIRYMTIDTGISSDGHIERVTSDMARAGINLEVYEGKGLDWYCDNVLKFGFAYTPSAHTIYYRNLKERAIEDCIRRNKTKYHERIGFITGVRRLESFRRSETPIVYQRRARVTINAIAEFDDRDKQVVLSDCHWWQGRSTDDCLCNWTCNHRLEDLKHEARIRIEDVNKQLSDIGLWTYGNKPTSSQLQLLSSDEEEEMPIDSLCVNCNKPKQLRLFK